MCLAGQGLAGGGWWGEQGLKCPLTYNQCEVVVCAGKSRGKLWHRLERTKSSGKPEQQNEGMKGVAICLERRECQRLREWMKWKSTVPVKSLQMTLNDGGWTKGLRAKAFQTQTHQPRIHRATSVEFKQDYYNLLWSESQNGFFSWRMNGATYCLT